MPAVAGRRTYTEDELQAALRDIQTGKLGTRRAAVIYGIPRSTLRNKVYKLALERERESHLNPSAAPLKPDDDEAMDDDKELSGAEEEKEIERTLQGPLLTMKDILRVSNMEESEVLRGLLKGKEDTWAGLDHSAVGPCIQNILLQSGGVLHPKSAIETEVNPILREVLRKFIVEEKIRTTSSHQNNDENERLTRPSPSNSASMRMEKTRSESDMETEETSPSVILKIPSFKPTSSSNKNNGCEFYRGPVDGCGGGSLVSPPVTSESGSPPIPMLPTKMILKDAIAKTISHKFQQSPDPITRHPMMDIEYKRSGFTPPLAANMSVIKQQQQQQQQPEVNVARSPYQPQVKPQQLNNVTPSQGGKGTRPKRGKYRNYDRDSLVEAVRAVQRGEMSVHRAGSYYGVPHSTLEYKVKERHLMRPRKRDPKPNPVDEKIASLKQNDLRNAAVAAAAAEKMKPILKGAPPQKYPPTSPNGMKIPMYDPNMTLYNAAPFPFWSPHGFSHIPLDYARGSTSTAFPTNSEQYYASQIMQKMQEESRLHPNPALTTLPPNATPALAKNTRQIAESLLDAGANGSFLDGIIRSSLESGVPAGEEKPPKEEKGVSPENMSNKALLDQLCRNSRMTPLTKVSEAGSSGDESYHRKGSSPFASGSSKDGFRQEPSPKPADCGGAGDVHTIELSNDSNETERKERDEHPRITPGRIYLNPELTKPENLKPELLVRFRDVLHEVQSNGVGVGGGGGGSDPGAPGSASDTDHTQD